MLTDQDLEKIKAVVRDVLAEPFTMSSVIRAFVGDREGGAHSPWFDVAPGAYLVSDVESRSHGEEWVRLTSRSGGSHGPPDLAHLG